MNSFPTLRSSDLRKSKVTFAIDGAAEKMASYSTEPKMTKVAKMPSAKPKSPTRLTMKALIAASFADGRSYQKPISRYEATPTPSQPKNIWTRLSEIGRAHVWTPVTNAHLV